MVNRTLLHILFALVFMAGCTLPADAQLSRIRGVWKGDIRTSQGPLSAVLHIEPDPEGGWTGTADTPTQGAWGIPLTSVTFADDGSFAMEIGLTGARFEARLSEDGARLTGSWKQNGVSLPLDCTRQPDPPPIPDVLRGAAVGIWEGVLSVGPVDLRVRLTLESRPDGALRGRFQSPDQSPIEYAVTRTDLLADERLRVAVGSLVTVFELGLSDDGARLEGVFLQGGATYAIELAKVEQATRLARPQTPRPPFPYRIEEVRYPGEEAGVTLAGTLTVPEGPGPHPVALLISGSGAQDRDETIFEHKPFWVLADALSRRGIAVLRVDDRGVGGSTAGADPAANTSADFAGDVRAGVAFLRARSDVGPVGLIGHSEGGLIAPLVAAENPAVAFVVLLAGPGVPGGELLYLQVEAINRAGGNTGPELEAGLALQRELMDIVAEASLSPEETSTRVRAALEGDPSFSQLEDSGTAVEQAVAELAVPWVRWFVRHDPRPVLTRLKCPVLALTGGLDLQVPSGPNLEAMRTALAAGANADFAVRELDGLNHLFQHAETGLVTEYGAIEETFAPEALDAIGAWLVERFVK